MLSKHRVMSPATRRIAAGATLGLAVLGLGITASGTQAAETIRSKVETVTGVEIAQVEAQAAAALAPVAAIVPAQAAVAAPLPAPAEPAPPAALPAKPAAPAIAARPAVPATPAGPAAAVDGDVRKIVVQRFDGDGKLLGQTVNDIPEIRVVSGNCGPGSLQQTSVTRTEGGKQVTTICSDRIRIVTRQAEFRAREGARMAAMGAAQAERGRAQAAQGEVYARQGMRTALAGLRSARASIQANRDMPGEARTSALEGIDESIREIQSEIDTAD